LARTIVLLAVAALIASVVTAAGDAGSKVGANCVQPLDLYSNFQDLSHCNLKGVTIDGNVPRPGSNPLYGSNLTGTNLTGATVQGGYKPLQFANLSGANLKGATLGGGPNETGVLQSANLTGANLSDTTISGSRPLSLANRTGANLLRASISGSPFGGLDQPLSGAIYSSTTCPDGANSDNVGGTCVGHGVPG
jgi:uncharacterized protein YjbI with pentapeptide repeats